MHSKIGFSALAIAGLTFGAVGMMMNTSGAATPPDCRAPSSVVGSPAAGDGGNGLLGPAGPNGPAGTTGDTPSSGNPSANNGGNGSGNGNGDGAGTNGPATG